MYPKMFPLAGGCARDMEKGEVKKGGVIKSVAVESLETRQLLSAAFMEAGGRLVVWGTSGDDTITIGRNPNNSDQIRVQMNAQTFDFASQYVKLVKVEGRAGNDLI